MALAASVQKDISKEGLSKPALRAFFRIADAWTLSPEEQMALLGGVKRATYFNWKKRLTGRLPKDTLERLSYVLGIYKALQILLPEPHAADAWIKKPNDAPLFGGKSALHRILQGHVSDLYVVRQYLDAERGGWA